MGGGVRGQEIFLDAFPNFLKLEKAPLTNIRPNKNFNLVFPTKTFFFSLPLPPTFHRMTTLHAPGQKLRKDRNIFKVYLYFNN